MGPKLNLGRGILGCVAVAIGLLLFAAPASALSKHVFSTSFAGSGTNALSNPNSVEVDQFTHDVYVSDPTNFRVERFDSSGDFILMFGKGVDKTTGADVCTAASGDECQAAIQGSSPGAFVSVYENFGYAGTRLWLAVDNSCALHKPELTGAACETFDPSAGDVYVADPGDNKVSKFDENGNLISTWGDQGQLDGTTIRGGSFASERGLQGIAVDPTEGDLFTSSHLADLDQLNQEGSFLAGAESGEPSAGVGPGIAVDPAGQVYDFNNFNGGNEVVAYPQLSAGIYASQLHPHGVTPNDDYSEGSGLAINPLTRDLYVDSYGSVAHYSASCVVEPCKAALDVFGSGVLTASEGLAIDAATSTVYAADTSAHRVAVFTPVPYLPDATPSSAQAKAPTEELLQGEVDPAAPGEVTACQFEYVHANGIETLSLSGATGGTFILGFTLKNSDERYTPPIPFDVEAEGLERTLESLVGTGGHGSVTVSGPEGGPFRVEFTERLGNNRDEPSLSADPSGLTPPGATVTVTNEPGAQWATATAEECAPNSFTAETQVTAETTGLTYGTAYDFRLAAENAAGSVTSFTEAFTTLPLAPTIGASSVNQVFAETAQIHAQINPNGGEASYHTAYHAEYVTSAQLEANVNEGKDPFTGAGQGPSRDAGSARAAQRLIAPLSGLQPDTTYHYRVIASNECEADTQCKAESTAHTFTTLPLAIPKDDTCPNAHLRQQTSAAQLLDCRAYELVSAAHTAGYDVESNLIEGQTPFAGYPKAKDPSGEPRVLYGIHDGGIPGAGEPTNRGVDPYLASRGENGWSTSYVGIPANGTPSAAPFGSPLLEADLGLDTLAFGGPGICSPCFAAGIETGIPLHLPDVERPVQGMGPQNAETEAAKPDGYIAKYFSAGGTHLVFGSTSRFTAGGNEETGDVSIYDRSLATGQTHVVSNDPEGNPLPCLQGLGKCHSSASPSKNDRNGIAELDISADGSRILLAQKVAEDAVHNVYWHLYTNVGDKAETIDLTPGIIAAPGGPGFKAGVLFDGMTDDGSRVYFTTADQLLSQDTDSSADIYVWSQQGEAEGEPLSLISAGEAGTDNTDACDPVAPVPGHGEGEHWNTLSPEANCDAVAISGGGGVASEEGSVYFLSPERLRSCDCVEPLLDPIQDQPNLYLARPGAAPRFIATLEPDNPLVLDAVKATATRRTPDFQVTPSGEFAAFPSTLALLGQGEEIANHTVLYRYDAATEKLGCISCTLTETPSTGDSSLASNGLSLTDEGRVFFSSTDPLAASDTDENQDVYEWEEKGVGNCQQSSPSFSTASAACRALISAGTSTVSSGLLGASSDGTDAYFFTRDSLTPFDENGPTIKIYDARQGGGFPYLFPALTCKASDECHGAASPAPGPLQLGTLAGAPHNYEARCKKGFAKQHGVCVKKPKHHKNKHHRRAKHHHRGGAR